MHKSKRHAPTQTKHVAILQSSNDESDDPLTRFVEDSEDADAATPTTSEPAQPIDKFASKIGALWHRSIESIWELAAACAEAAKQLSPDQKKKLVKKLPFDESTFSKLVQTGKDQRILENLKRLPASMSTLYEITFLSDKQLQLGIETGIIDADATREDIKDFRAGGKPAPKAGAPSKPGGTNKAQHSAGSSGRTTSKHENFDDFPEGNQESLDDDLDSPEPSESDEDYDALVADWKTKGLRRTKWQATPKIKRQRFIKEVLCRESFRPPFTARTTTW
jgi:hypothetical protein